MRQPKPNSSSANKRSATRAHVGIETTSASVRNNAAINILTTARRRTPRLPRVNCSGLGLTRLNSVKALAVRRPHVRVPKTRKPHWNHKHDQRQSAENSRMALCSPFPAHRVLTDLAYAWVLGMAHIAHAHRRGSDGGFTPGGPGKLFVYTRATVGRDLARSSS
jgi:hypothetical protein